MEDFKLDEMLQDDSKEKQLEEAKKVTRLFKKVFNNDDGKKVLGIILEDLHYFTSCETEAATTLCNYAKFLVSNRLGINNHKEIIDHLMDL